MPKTRWAMPLLVSGCTLLTIGCGELRRPGAPSETVMAPADTAVDTSTASATTPATNGRSRRARSTSAPTRSDQSQTAAAPDTVQPPPPPPRPSPFAGARSDLQRLVTAQEQHIANVGRYASRAQYLALRYLPHAGVHLTIVSATDSGWIGRATRDGSPGGSCVVWVGKVPTKPRTERFNMQPLTSGVAVCDSI